MTGHRDRVRAYYAAFGAREWERLEKAEGATQLAVTAAKLDEHLGAASYVLDLGGGPGRYALRLAERGHTVSLADLSPELLAIARGRIAAAGVGDAICEVVEADATDLSRWTDATFDAALCLGPFYHLPAKSDRDAAARGLARVVRPGGLVFVALIPRQAFVRRTLAVPEERHHLADAAWMRRLLVDGVFANDVPGRFDGGYGARPEEIADFFAARGLEPVELVACDGPAAGRAVHPRLLATASHVLFVGRRC